MTGDPPGNGSTSPGGRPGPRAAGYVVLFLLLVAAWLEAASLGIERDPLRLLPEDIPQVNAYVGMLRRFGRMDAVLVDLSGAGEPFSPLVEAAASRICSELDQGGLARIAVGRIPLGKLEQVRLLLREHRAALFSPEIERRVADHTSAEFLRKRVRHFRKSLALFPDPAATVSFREDPLSLDEVYLALLPRPADVATRTALVDGWIWSADGMHLLLVAIPPAGSSLPPKDFVGRLREILDRASREEGGGTVRAGFFCWQRAAVDNELAVRGDLRRSLILSFLLVAILLRLGTGSWHLVPLSFLPPVAGLAGGLAAAALFFGRVSPIVAGSGAILLGIAVDYGVHVIRALRAAPAVSPSRSALRAVRKPLLVAAFTTAAAFSVLLASDLPGHRQLGVVCSVGILVALGSSVLFLPLVAEPATRRWPVTPADRIVQAAHPVVARSRIVAGVLLVAATTMALVGLFRVRLDSGLQRFNALSPESRADLERISAAWGSGPDSVAVLVRGATPEEALSRGELAWKKLRELGPRLGLADIRGITGFLPPRGTQRENRRRWQDFWSPPRLSRTRRILREELSRQGFSPGFLGNRWEYWLGDRGGFLAPSELKTVEISWLLRDWLACTRGECFSRVVFRVPGRPHLSRVLREVREALPESTVASGLETVEIVTRLALRELFRLGSGALLVVLLVLAASVRTPRLALPIGLVLLLTPAWSIGFLGWAGIPLTLLNSILVVFAFGLGIDYAVFLLLDHSTDAPGGSPVPGGVLVCGATTLAGFGALLVARHPALHELGATATVTIASGLVVSFLVSTAFRPARHDPDEQA